MTHHSFDEPVPIDVFFDTMMDVANDPAVAEQETRKLRERVWLEELEERLWAVERRRYMPAPVLPSRPSQPCQLSLF